MSQPPLRPRHRIQTRQIRIHAIGICISLLALSPSASPRGAESSVSTLVAIVNEAGLLAPIVRFDGDAWQHSWPEPSVAVPADVGAADVAPKQRPPLEWTGGMKPPVTWYALRRDAPADTPARAIRVGALVRFASHCTTAFGLQSDLRDVLPSAGGPRPTPDQTFPKRSIAIAVSNPAVRIQPTQPADADAPHMREPLKAAAAAFLAAAAETAARHGFTRPGRAARVDWTRGKLWSYTLSAGARPTHAMPALRADDVDRVYLLEGRVPLDAAAADSPALHGFVWLRMRHDIVIERTATVMPWDPDGKFDRTHVPMGVLVIGDRRFWLHLEHGYEDETLRIVELTTPGFDTRVAVSLGGC